MMLVAAVRCPSVGVVAGVFVGMVGDVHVVVVVVVAVVAVSYTHLTLPTIYSV